MNNAILKNLEAKNIFFVLLQNITNYIFPLITFAYILRKLGFENFGLISLINTNFTYIIIIAEYGFIISATRDISLNKSDTDKVNFIITKIVVVKFILFILSFLILLATYPFNHHLRDNFVLYLASSGIAFGQVFFPIWFFQGVQNLRVVTLSSIFIKILQTVTILLFINKNTDVLKVQIINSAAQILNLFIAYFLMYRRYKFHLKYVSRVDIYKTLKEGWYLFISNISVTLYTTSITALLGFLHGNGAVGYYVAAEKIVTALKSLTLPISQVIYPKLVELSKISKLSVLNYNKKVLKVISPIFIALGFLIIFSAETILRLFTGHTSVPTINILKILSFLPFIIFLHTIFSLCTLLVFNQKKLYSTIIIYAGLIGLTLSYPIILFFSYYGAASMVIVVEFSILIAYIISTEKKRLSLLH